MCVSWALTLFFSLSWRQLSWGSSPHESTREALELGPRTLHRLYVCECHSLQHPYNGIAPVCVLVSCIYTPSFNGIPTVRASHLMEAADLEEEEKKKNKVNPKNTVANMHMYRIQQSSPKQTTLYHTTVIPSWKHFYVTFISPVSHPSAASPHPGGLTLTERQML